MQEVRCFGLAGVQDLPFLVHLPPKSVDLMTIRTGVAHSVKERLGCSEDSREVVDRCRQGLTHRNLLLGSSGVCPPEIIHFGGEDLDSVYRG